jgi:hypothetical protein
MCKQDVRKSIKRQDQHCLNVCFAIKIFALSIKVYQIGYKPGLSKIPYIKVNIKWYGWIQKSAVNLNV